jgi:hypothetical protein
MHAEIGSMYQALKAGKRGGSGVLRITGLEKCGPCKGDIKAMARKLGLEELTVYDADGKVYKFVGKELLPVAQGGKPWK